ncbi:hypothetical protein GOV11_04555 [Candidatus Woesearchaeota archaeon]|nr:hypothetical protein [Candidatus Woesearchaeota archaeon]
MKRNREIVRTCLVTGLMTGMFIVGYNAGESKGIKSGLEMDHEELVKDLRRTRVESMVAEDHASERGDIETARSKRELYHALKIVIPIIENDFESKYLALEDQVARIYPINVGVQK